MLFCSTQSDIKTYALGLVCKPLVLVGWYGGDYSENLFCLKKHGEAFSVRQPDCKLLKELVAFSYQVVSNGRTVTVAY